MSELFILLGGEKVRCTGIRKRAWPVVSSHVAVVDLSLQFDTTTIDAQFITGMSEELPIVGKMYRLRLELEEDE